MFKILISILSGMETIMKKGDRFEGLVTEYDFPNIGIVNVDDNGETRKVKVKNAIIGQYIEAVVYKKKTGLLEARLENVLKRSDV